MNQQQFATVFIFQLWAYEYIPWEIKIIGSSWQARSHISWTRSSRIASRLIVLAAVPYKQRPALEKAAIIT